MSEESGEFGNPRLLSNGLPSGHPPESSPGSDALVTDDGRFNQQMQRICSGPLLEKPGSPLSLGLQGHCKKLHGSDMQDQVVWSNSMEVEDDGKTVDSSLGGVASTPNGHTWMSYANIVGTSLQRNNGGRDDLEDLESDPNKIVDNVPKEASANFEVEIVTKEVSSGDRGLFGPWMTVKSRRKRSLMGGQASSRGHGKHVASSVDNRFVVFDNEQVEPIEDQRVESSNNVANKRDERNLEPVHRLSNVVFVEDNRGVSKNEAYRASNPERKSKESR
ncbi:hypothetical protein V6N13_135019 [Hibiscus sabdariffa]|uniref:Uncharacterized protein n=1 Tax=Hibiscus sabdariffa TaxID=183260 RepID=A0ABR2R5T8_9ROSI